MELIRRSALLCAPLPRRSRGLTLIEMMISITISLVILAALSYAYLGSRGAYRSNENLARMQESARFALEFLGEDLRMSSFYGCRSRLMTSDRILMVARPEVPILNPTLSLPPNGVTGYENGSGWPETPSVTVVPNNDIITIWRATGAAAELAEDTNQTAETVKIVRNTAGFRKNDIVMLADCERAVVFRVTNTPTGSTNVVLRNGATVEGGGTTNGNGNNSYVTGTSSNQFPSMRVNARPAAYRFAGVSYFIGTNPGGRPALYRTADGVTEELADNIEAMDILYGIDNVNGDFVADSYVPASSVGNWAQVVSVRVSLLVASPEATAATNVQTYLLRDTNGDGTLDSETAPDTRLRQVVTTTVSLRNRTL
jgi:type IV pilus assembly protein PilW